jgi:hypothetical protein
MTPPLWSCELTKPRATPREQSTKVLRSTTVSADPCHIRTAGPASEPSWQNIPRIKLSRIVQRCPPMASIALV